MNKKPNPMPPEKVQAWIMDLLIDGRLTVKQMARMINITTKRVSYSILELARDNKIDSCRNGRQIFWYIPSKEKKLKVKKEVVINYNKTLTQKWV